MSSEAGASTIIGIDPGSRLTGYGLIAQTGKTLRYVASGCIRTHSDNFCERLMQIFDGVSQLMREYQADAGAIESVFMHQNASAALKLGQARGAAIVAMTSHAVTVGEYSPRQIKQSVVGFGGAKKEQVQQMVRQLLSLSGVPQADAADALAVAICHAHTLTGLASMAGVSGVARGRLR